MRTLEEIVANPLAGDIIPAKIFGDKWGGRRIWDNCDVCGEYAWKIVKSGHKQSKHCLPCRSKCQIGKHRGMKGNFITITDIPKEGDFIYGHLLGKRNKQIYRWTKCTNCSVFKWVLKSKRNQVYSCGTCSVKKKIYKTGVRHPSWKGGRKVGTRGYIEVQLLKDDPYFPMAPKSGYVMEHRLVMAQHLGRCLSKGEVVHHKHTKYPVSSIEDKQDNRIENLELCVSSIDHNIITVMERQIVELQEKVRAFGLEARTNKWRIKQLEDRIRIENPMRLHKGG